MAGLPPDTIQVKRKRGTDDGPVDFLRLERSKRYRSQSGDSGWVYRRKQADAAPDNHAAEPSAPAIPTIRPTKEGDEARLLRGSNKPAHPLLPSDTPAPKTPSESPPSPETKPSPESRIFIHPNTDRIRRFHLSRSNSPQPAPTGVSKKRTVPAVFIERGAKKQRESLKAIIREHDVSPTPTSQTVDSETVRSSSPTQEPTATVDEQPSTIKYKRPGTKARPLSTITAATTTTPSATPKPVLPPSLRDREGTHGNMDELARVMDSWTIAEITKNLDRMDSHDTTSKYSPAKSRFRPKAPKQRYFERHPEAAAAQQAAVAATPAPAAPPGMDIDTGETTDEEDYVLETYERVPVERLRDQAVPAHRVGLLVFDTEPDMVEFFYGNESDSEDEFPEDDEDENAENYYTTEYPDEDLEWDDEFDQNPYHYVNGNASDLEEFDERDFVDDVWEKSDIAGGLPGQPH